MNKLPRYCVLIPCLNEELAIGALLRRVLTHCSDVIVVDDGSDDRTPEIVSNLPVTLLRHATRRGKGEALRTGFREAIERGYDAALTMDGDGQHLPEDIPRIADAAARYPNHVVIGARLLNRAQQPAGRRFANAFADWGISWGCGKPVADTQSGQRWYPRAAMQLVDVKSEDFVFEAAILIAACRDLDMGVVSVPIESRYAGEFRLSHFRPVGDTVRITLYTIGRVAHYGNIVGSYRRSHGTPPLVHDPDGLCAAIIPQPARAGPA